MRALLPSRQVRSGKLRTDRPRCLRIDLPEADPIADAHRSPGHHARELPAMAPGLGDEAGANALQLRAGDTGLGQLQHDLVAQLQLLAGRKRLQRDALQKDVLLEHGARDPEQIQLGLIREENLAAMPARASRVSIPDQPTLGLRNGGLDGTHRLAAPSGEAKGFHHAGCHGLPSSIGAMVIGSTR